jgi:hypothetical protein
LNYNRLHTAFLILSLAFIGLMVDSCKSKKQEIPPFIDVHLEVKDANNVPSTGATVYLYNSEEAFQTAYQNSLNLIYNSTGSILTTTIVNGTVDLKGLPSNTEYWILVHDTSEAFVDPKNPTFNTGYKIDKDNSEAYYKIDGFQNGTTVLANITLQPVSSLVTFTNNSGVNSFQKVEVGRDVMNNFASGGYKKVRKGDVSYMARTNECVWTGAVDAVGGEVVSESLVACSAKPVTFQHAFTPAEVSAGMTIRIYIGQNKNNMDSKPLILTALNPSQSIILANDSKVYTYFAEFEKPTAVNKCVWQGEIVTPIVTLAACN